MRKYWLAISLVAVGLVFGVGFLLVSAQTAGPALSRGAPVTNQGWTALLSTFAGAFGLTGTGILVFVVQKLRDGIQKIVSDIKGGSTPETADRNEIVELLAAAANAVTCKFSKPSQRRLYFAGIEMLAGLDGCQVNQLPNGSISIAYSGISGIPLAPDPVKYIQSVAAPLMPVAPQTIPQPAPSQPISPPPASVIPQPIPVQPAPAPMIPVPVQIPQQVIPQPVAPVQAAAR